MVWLGLILPHFDHGFLWHQGKETVETAKLCWGKTFQVQECRGLIQKACWDKHFYTYSLNG